MAGAAAVAIALGGGGRASAASLVPDHAKVQFAGAIGMVSGGTGWALAGRRLELDVFFGWVPAAVADVDLVAITGKLTWLPWSARLDRSWRLRPITAGFAFTYWAGDRFFVQHPERYPSGYYPLPTALRASVQLGGTFGRAVGPFSEAGIYWELVAVDLPLAYWIDNRDGVSATDVLSLALGVRAEF